MASGRGGAPGGQTAWLQPERKLELCFSSSLAPSPRPSVRGEPGGLHVKGVRPCACFNCDSLPALIHQTCESVTVLERGYSVGVMKLRIFRWGEDPALARWAGCNHRRPGKTETGRSDGSGGSAGARGRGGAGSRCRPWRCGPAT